MNILVNIDVPDLEQACRFYTAAFELQVSRRFGAAGVELSGGSSKVYLLCKAAGSVPCPVCTDTRDYGRHWTPVHVDFVVDDIEAAVARAEQAGAVLEVSIQDAAWGRLAPMSDPFGNGFCFVQFQGRGYDGIST